MARKQYINFVNGLDAPYIASFNADRGAGPNRFFSATVDVTVRNGTVPTLQVDFEQFDEASQKFIAIAGATLTQSIVGTSSVDFDVNSERIRAVVTIGGTNPEFTFTLGAATAPN